MIRTLIAVTIFALAGASHTDAATPDLYRDTSGALLRQGQAALEAGDYKEARSRLETALVANPGNAQAMVLLGQTHEAIGNDQLGAGYYRRALVVEPDNRAALLGESLALLKADNPEGAKANEERLARLCAQEGCAELEALRKALSTHKTPAPE